MRNNGKFFSLHHGTIVWLLLWLMLVISFTVWLPGFAEADTAKYLSIAKQMMLNHNYTTAYWQGQLYSDKPPLLFWLIIAGWKVFGVCNWWPQLLVLLTATTGIFVSQQLAITLWPQNIAASRTVPFILTGCFYWIWFAKQIRVDAILMLAILLSLLFLLKTTATQRKSCWIGYLLAVGLGAFAKGPVIVVFLALPAMLLPLLLKQRQSPVWYVWLAITTLLGLAIPLLWAIPAALQGGSAFTQQIFYRQITSRIHNFHTSPFFYILRLPLWLLPWSIYPPFLKACRDMRVRSGEGICLVMICSSLIIFSLFPQKLPHYLYPLFPVFAVLIAHLITSRKDFNYQHQWPTAALVAIIAMLCLLFPIVWQHFSAKLAIRSYFMQGMNLTSWGAFFCSLTLLLLVFKPKTQFSQITLISISTISIAFFVNNAVLFHYQQHHTHQPLINRLKSLPAIMVRIDDSSTPIQDKTLLDYIERHQLRQRQSANSTWLITTAFSRQQKMPEIWYYQTRYSIVSLIQAVRNERIASGESK